MIRHIILGTIVASACRFSIGQTQPSLAHGPYFVDRQIEPELKKFAPGVPGALKNSMSIKVFWDTKTPFDQSLDCFTKSFLRNDTIYIYGEMIGELGYGFELALFRDSCIVASFAISDGKIYKYNKSDVDSISFIPLPSITQKLTVLKKPSFKNGEVISGKVQIKSVPFYYVGLEGKFRIELVAYFKTEPVQETK